jgi:class 3 adenylate cyclase
LNSTSENLWLIGSDEHEWFSGREVTPLTVAHTSEQGGHESEILRLYAFEEGRVGWAAVEERRTYPTGRRSVFRLTLVFELESGSWKVVHSHFSAPVPNLETVGVDLPRSLSDLDLPRSLSDLVDSIEDGSDLSPTLGLSGTATLMFTDIVDSTPLSISLGETAWFELISEHFDTLRKIAESEGGSVVKTMGDGGMYAFASGSSALKAATRMQRAVTEGSGPGLQVRIGVHTGDVIHTDDDIRGSTVAKAARVAAAAAGRQILVSSTTAGLMNSSEFEFGTPATVELKGLAGTHQLQPLNWS